MKKIICYGDSNTYGFNPYTMGRYENNERWTGILSEYLCGFEILEEGMNNRLGFFESPDGFEYSGNKYLPVLLNNIKDFDIFILALGTNDLQFFYNLDEQTTFSGLTDLLGIIKNVNSSSKIIIIPPVKINEDILNGFFVNQFDKKSIERVNNVFHTFRDVAQLNNCYYYDFNEIVKPSNKDGLHYTKESHRIIAKNLAEYIKKIA